MGQPKGSLYERWGSLKSYNKYYNLAKFLEILRDLRVLRGLIVTMKNKKNVLFVCIGNSCRSQMAEGYARAWGAEIMDASSAGTYAIGFINDPVIEVMREEGIDIYGGHPKQITRDMVEEADLVIALGGDPERFFPDLLRDKLITWPTPDPFGDSLERTREIRDMIKTRISDLIIDLADLGNGE